MPNEYVNHVIVNGVTKLDLRGDTISASDLAQGITAHDRSGAPIVGTASGGGGNGYVLTTVCPQQTVTTDSNRQAVLSNFTTGLTLDESYLVTLDGDQYLVTCGVVWTNNYLIGDDNVIYATGDHVVPFCIDWVSAQDNMLVTLYANQTHTVKVEHIELIDPLVLTTKTITANGTYSASTDNADGYSSVTVNVSGGGGGGNYQAKTNVDPSTSSQTITPDSGYDALSSVQINAMPSGAVSASATKGTVSNHSISVTPKATVGTAGYLPTGTTNGTAVTVSASELVSGSETKTANGTYDVTNLASLVVALDFATYYVSSSNPTGGNNGDIWLKTVS